jgi:hypothetical protein
MSSRVVPLADWVGGHGGCCVVVLCRRVLASAVAVHCLLRALCLLSCTDSLWHVCTLVACSGAVLWPSPALLVVVTWPTQGSCVLGAGSSQGTFGCMHFAPSGWKRGARAGDKAGRSNCHPCHHRTAGVLSGAAWWVGAMGRCPIAQDGTSQPVWCSVEAQRSTSCMAALCARPMAVLGVWQELIPDRR